MKVEQAQQASPAEQAAAATPAVAGTAGTMEGTMVGEPASKRARRPPPVSAAEGYPG